MQAKPKQAGLPRYGYGQPKDWSLGLDDPNLPLYGPHNKWVPKLEPAGLERMHNLVVIAINHAEWSNPSPAHLFRFP